MPRGARAACPCANEDHISYDPFKLDNPELSCGKWLAEFRFYASTLLDGAGLRLEWQATGFDSALIGDVLASLSLLRALREALHNAVRHA